MCQQELLLRALHLRAELQLRRAMRLQEPQKCQAHRAQLIAHAVRELLQGPGRNTKVQVMRTSFLLGSAAPLFLMLGLAIPGPLRATLASEAVQDSAAVDRLSLPPPKAGRHRPLVVLLADNAGTQTTDFSVPYGILKESGVAEVRSVSMRAGLVRMTRGLTIETDETVMDFDGREPTGADVVIVPAQANPKDKAMAKWLRSQAAKGAVIMSICEGSRVLANAGLLDGRHAASHWSSIPSLAKSYPDTNWVRDRRYIQDGPIISTAGVTASIPASLALVEAIGGHDAADTTARKFGIAAWGSAHRTSDFAIGKADIAAVIAARKGSQETSQISIADGVDEVALALHVDAWGRTEHTRVVTARSGRAAVRSRHGLVIVPDAELAEGTHALQLTDQPAIAQFEGSLAEIERRYGAAAVRLVALGMEYDFSRPAPQK